MKVRNKSSLGPVWQGVVGLSSALALMLTSIPANAVAANMEFEAPRGPPPRTAPGTVHSPTKGVEMSGDEAGLGLNSCKKWESGRKYTVTVPKEAELEQLVQWMMTISCQKFIWNAKIRSGKVSILSPEKITLREAYAAFYAALESMGLTVEPSGDYFKIVETSDAKSLNVPTYPDGKTVPNNDRFVTQLIRLKNVSGAELLPVIKKIKSKQGHVESVGDLLVLTDRGSTIRRIQKIIDQLDFDQASEKIYFYQLKYAEAEQVGQIVREIFGEESGGKKSGTKKKSKKASSGSPTDLSFSRVIVDARTGTIIMVARPEDYATISKMIDQLDVRLPGGGGRLHYRKLKYADPEEVAKTLSQLAQAGAKRSGGANKRGNKTAAEGGAAAELFSGDVKITADKATHSLIIMASAADFDNLEGVIKQLDVERKQLYIEIYLLEITTKRGLKAGAGGHFGVQTPPVGSGNVSGPATAIISSAPARDLSSIAITPDGLDGLASGILGPLIPNSGQLFGVGRDIPSFGFLLQALSSHEDTNVLSAPHFPTADNAEANLEIGKRVPTQGALSFGGGAGGSSLMPIQSIQREDVTLNIKVTPHINDERAVTLDVEIDDKDIAGQDPKLGVTTTKRRLKFENVMGYDDEPIVLGGLIRERESINVQQVPGLGSIPILGWLFKRKERSREKVNLLIIMVPHIINSPSDIRRIESQRTKERLEFLERETKFKRSDFKSHVNYSRKAGLLSNIDREARRTEFEELKYRQAQEELSRESITGEIGLVPRQQADSSTSSSSDEKKASSASSKSKSKSKPKPGRVPNPR